MSESKIEREDFEIFLANLDVDRSYRGMVGIEVLIFRYLSVTGHAST